MVAISQLIATLWISQPRLEICVAVQIERKTGLLSGIKVVAAKSGECSGRMTFLTSLTC